MTHIRRRRTCIATRKRVIAYPTIISGTYPSLLFLITQRALVILSDALASRPGAAPSDALRAERRICFLRFSTVASCGGHKNSFGYGSEPRHRTRSRAHALLRGLAGDRRRARSGRGTPRNRGPGRRHERCRIDRGSGPTAASAQPTARCAREQRRHL